MVPNLDPYPIIHSSRTRFVGLGLARMKPGEYYFSPRRGYSQNYRDYLEAETKYLEERS